MNQVSSPFDKSFSTELINETYINKPNESVNVSKYDSQRGLLDKNFFGQQLVNLIW